MLKLKLLWVNLHEAWAPTTLTTCTRSLCKVDTAPWVCTWAKLILILILGRREWGGRCRGKECEEIKGTGLGQTVQGWRERLGVEKGLSKKDLFSSTCSICGRCYQYVRALSEGLSCQLIWLLLSMAAKYNCDDARKREKKRVQPQRAWKTQCKQVKRRGVCQQQGGVYNPKGIALWQEGENRRNERREKNKQTKSQEK